MLGKSIVDGCGVEGGGSISGMGLLPVHTEFQEEKHRSRVTGRVLDAGLLAQLSGASVNGYEIHMGKTSLETGAQALVELDTGIEDGCTNGNVFGTYLHGFFDSAECRDGLIKALCSKKGITMDEIASFDYTAYKERQYDLLADAVRGNLDMELIYRILEEGI